MTRFRRPQLKVCDRESSSLSFILSLTPGESVQVHFEDFDTCLTLLESDLCTASLRMILYADSVKSDDERITKQLSGPSCLGANEYRVIKFYSTEWEKLPNNEYLLYGNLTMRNRTNLVVFEVVDHGVSSQLNSDARVSKLEFEGIIKRTDFQMSSNTWASEHEDEITLKGILSFKSAHSNPIWAADSPTTL